MEMERFATSSASSASVAASSSASVSSSAANKSCNIMESSRLLQSGKAEADSGGDPEPGTASVEMLNPFVHKLELITSWEKIKTAILTVLVMPARLLLICLLLVTAWALACFGLYGVSEEDLASKPMTGWRLSLKNVISRFGRLSYLAGGMSVRVIGQQAPRTEAPVLVLAPHSSFLDSVIVYVTNMCSVMVRKESMDNFAGKLINFTQPLYVWRDDPNSRQNTIRKIIERAKSPAAWPQIIIFPEGTCTNRTCLITFKPGAFYPGVPVQPVCIRYPNALDTVTWTWEGPGFFKLIWLTLTRVHSYCEIEFLPVYVPNEAEKADPKLFARNVRAVMAKALSVPVSDYTFNDCKLMTRAKRVHISQAAQIVEIEAHRRTLGLEDSNIEEVTLENGATWTRLINEEHGHSVTLAEFAERLGLAPPSKLGAADAKALALLFGIFAGRTATSPGTGTGTGTGSSNGGAGNGRSNGQSGDQLVRTPKIDIRAYWLCAVFLITRERPTLDFLRLVCKIYALPSRPTASGSPYPPARLTMAGMRTVLHHVVNMPPEQSDTLFGMLTAGQEQELFKTVCPDDLIEQLQKMSQFKHKLLATADNNNCKPKSA